MGDRTGRYLGSDNCTTSAHLDHPLRRDTESPKLLIRSPVRPAELRIPLVLRPGEELGVDLNMSVASRVDFMLSFSV